MKIIHINYSDLQGGASIACNRLHNALINEKIDSNLVVVNKLSNNNSVFTFNKKSQNLYKHDIPVHLTTSEQKLLKCFCKSPNTPFSREDINNSLGGNMEIRSIDVAIARIRRKIEIDQRYPIYLQTVRGIGWMLQTHEDNNDEN